MLLTLNVSCIGLLSKCTTSILSGMLTMSGNGVPTHSVSEPALPSMPWDLPPLIHNGFCIFDYQKDWAKALRYRKQEVPFVVTGDPRVARAVERWNHPGYMTRLLGQDNKYGVDYNTNNHFMYHLLRKDAPDSLNSERREIPCRALPRRRLAHQEIEGEVGRRGVRAPYPLHDLRPEGRATEKVQR